MQLKKKGSSIVLVYKRNENMTWKKCYEICNAKVKELSEDKDIEHMRAVVDMLNKRIKAHDKRISLYRDMACAIKRDGKENDTTILGGSEDE